MQTLNIGFDAKRAFFNRSGLGNYSRNTINLLQKYFPEHNYYLYSPKSSNELFNFEDKKFTIRTKNDKFTPSSYWRSFSLSNIIKSDNIQIFHGLSNELPFTISKSKAKSIVTIHDLIFLRYPELYKNIDRKIYNYKFRKSCENATKIIAISNQTKSDIIEYFKIPETKIEVVYQTCNSSFYNKQNSAELKSVREKYNLPSNYILYVGTIEKRKNLLNIIKAINNYNINIPLIAVGRKTKYYNEIENYINKNNIINKLQILSGVENSELPSIYQMAEMLVYPSTFEGFGLPIIEALFSGIPVITSKGGCFSEAGGEGAIYVDPINIDEIGNAINSVLNNKELKDSLIENGKLQIKNFDEKIVTQKLMRVYEGV
ncbi:MAG: hypothetical protein A2033_17175 [Bacteroidetes bacterium GWA2_31_9]|nr:MAG: hypothetical protein A2033_17175 [Bacteroidetes bacterium GWA2_31_9]